MKVKQELEKMEKEWSRKPLAILLLSLFGILLDVAGKHVAVMTGTVLYIDSIGYLFAAIVGGYLPGILVGYFSNLLTGFADITNAYYGIISVLIAVVASYMADRGYFKKIWGVLLGIFLFAVIGGGVGGFLTYMLYGFDPSAEVPLGFIQSMMNDGRLSCFAGNMLSSFLIDLVDKAITMVICLILVRVFPTSWKARFKLHNLKNLVMTEAEEREAKKAYSRKMSLRAKVVFLVGTIMVCIAVVAGVICFMLYDRSTIDEHKVLGHGVATLAAGVIDGDSVDRFIEEGENAPGYQHQEELLYRVRESSPDIQYIYVYQIRPDGCHVVFDLDTDELEGSNPGDVIEFEDAFYDLLPTLLNGGEIEPIISDDSYGWLLTVYEPVKDSSGNTVCYACVDISMDQVRINERSFITKEFALFMGFIILVLAFTLWISEYKLLVPINAMALAADRFAYDNEEDLERGVDRMKRLDIDTGDEIEHLYHAFTKTIDETVGYISEVNKKNEMINNMQNNLILVLADMVESRDESTGDHIKKTAAYVELICRKMQAKEEHKAQFTEEYIENCVHSAPLHDVGKIKISDTVLNKPGKLTDEEFEIMKTHTTAGEEIIEHVIETVTESGYLTEAKNMAACHHEKWNGKGYPKGKKGTEIPMSARIMAVADVFDALISRRCYKEPFSFEKAMEIIKEGSGEHFDPELVEIFLASQDEVRAIAEANMSGPLIERKKKPGASNE